MIDLNNTLEDFSTDNVKVSVTLDDIALKSNLKPNQTLIFTKKPFFCRVLDFIRSRSYSLDDIDVLYQLIAKSHKSNEPNNCTGIDKVQLKCDCVNGSIMDGAREPILYSFALNSPPGLKVYKIKRKKF